MNRLTVILWCKQFLGIYPEGLLEAEKAFEKLDELTKQEYEAEARIAWSYLNRDEEDGA